MNLAVEGGFRPACMVSRKDRVILNARKQIRRKALRIEGTVLSVCCVCVTLAASLNAQAVNSASDSPLVAPGSLVSIYEDLENATGAAVSLPLPTSLSDGRFYIVFNWTPGTPIVETNRVPLLYWSPSQINVVLPAATDSNSLLAITLFPNLGTQTTNVVAMNVAAQAPGIFVNPTTDCSFAAGCGRTLERGIITDASYALVSSSNPARPNQTIVAWLTGLGVNPTAPKVVVVPAVGAPLSAVVTYSGHTSFAGLDQVNFTLPGGVALMSGCSVGAHLEIQMSMQSVATGAQSNAISLPVLIDSCK